MPVEYVKIKDDEGRPWDTWRAEGENGEGTGRGEKYSSESNARRGAADHFRVLLQAVADGEIDLTLKT